MEVICFSKMKWLMPGAPKLKQNIMARLNTPVEFSFLFFSTTQLHVDAM